MSKMKSFIEDLINLGIDPESWEAAREAKGEWSDYRLAKDLEMMILSASRERIIRLKDGDSILDPWATLWSAMSRWPLEVDDSLNAAA